MYNVLILDIIQLALLLGACFSCYIWGRVNGSVDLMKIMVDNRIISNENLKRLDKVLDKKDTNK